MTSRTLASAQGCAPLRNVQFWNLIPSSILSEYPSSHLRSWFVSLGLDSIKIVNGYPHPWLIPLSAQFDWVSLAIGY